MNTLEELKERASAGDLQALQELRDRGFFAQTKAKDGYPVSNAQRRLWIAGQLVEGFGAYNIPIALTLEGELNPAALRGALQAVVCRHESLRTTFATVDGTLRQFIHEDVNLQWEDLDLTDTADGEQRARLIAADHASRPFDLVRGPLLRAALVRLAPHRHLFLFNLHHIIGDLVSLRILIRELSVCYEACAHGRPPPLAPLPIQYKDFAAWQNRLLAGDEAARHRAYWLEQLAGTLEPLSLPTDFPRPPFKTYRGHVCRTMLDAGLTERVRQLGLKYEMTLFMVLAAALKVLLYRYTGQEDVIIGFPLAGRDHPDLTGQIGCFVNTVALRDRLAADYSFGSLLGRVRQTMLDAYEHQAYPFDRLVEELDLPRDMSRSPVFVVSLSLANAGQEELQFGGVRISSDDDGFASSKVDLSFDFFETGDGLELAIAYCTDLFSAERVQRMAEHFVRLTTHAVESPERLISRLPLMAPDEEQRVLFGFNQTARGFASDETIVDMFERQARRTPDAVVAKFGDRQLSFGELNRWANRLAGLLHQYGVGRETMVGLFMEPSLEMVCAFLGILKAGGVYVPLDPANPLHRLAAMLDDARLPLILTQESLGERLPATPGCLPLLWDEVEEAMAGQADGNRIREAGLDHVAYVIFTSGSTGRPKGTVLLHRGLANVASEQARLFAPGLGDRVLQFATLGFDASVFEMVMALCNGAALCLATREQLLPGPALLATLQREEISIATFPPSALAAQPEAELPKLRIVAVAGEACPADVVRRWARGRAFFNLYGPTEATIWTSTARCEPDGRMPTIGSPIGNTRIYVLDRHLQPVPLGVPGELCIAGAGLARHYLNRPDMTEARFVADPFDPTPGARIYLTGDLGRYLPDGAIEFLGRIDHQVKLRGFRIEPGEIESALAQHPGIREAVVLAREVEPGHQRLVAYATSRVAGTPLDANELRQFLKERVPEYMVPAQIVLLDEMPLTTSKKIDRKALPSLDGGWSGMKTGFVAPRDDLQQALASLFAEVLRVERVGIEDNFFELGGDSLLATRIVSRLYDAFRVDITIPQLFRAGNVRAMAEVVRCALPAGQAEKIAAVLLRLQTMTTEKKRELLDRRRARVPIQD
jgi:amino acid adenylation domain-containing protein